MGKTWSPEELEAIGEFRRVGVIADAVAILLDRSRASIFYANTRDKRLAGEAERRSKPEWPAYHKSWRENHREEWNAMSARWAAENPEKRRAQKARFYARHPEARAIEKARRRTREGNGTFTKAEWREIQRKQNGRCLDCGVEASLSVGHLVPLSRGGSNSAANIVGQCMPCNRKQASRLHPSVVAA
jgi:hypothetical protein